MKSLVLADVHANLAALEAVLEAEGSWDEVLFLGDAVKHGPQPEEVMSILSKTQGFFVMGNHDREVLDIELATPATNPDVRWTQWVRGQLSGRNARVLADFSGSCAVERDGMAIRLHHGDLPGELGRRIWPDSPSQAFDAVSSRFPEPVFLHGHTHVQFKVERGGRLFVNPGGVGQQRLGQPLACYAVLQDGEFDLRAVPYDIEKTCRAMGRVPLGDEEFVESWKTCYRTGVLPARYNIRDFAPLARTGHLL